MWSTALATHWRRETLRTSLWFVPAIEVLAAIGLFVATTALDKAAYRGSFAVPSWVISGTADAAREILTAIAAALITVVGVVFSIILVTLTLASTQFGPRMLRNFHQGPGDPADARHVRCNLRLRGAGAGLDRQRLARRLRAAHRGDGDPGADGRRPGCAHLTSSTTPPSPSSCRRLSPRSRPT